MSLSVADLSIIIGYLVLTSLVGFIVRKQATKSTTSYFLADRNVPWWMLGLAGCSSYIDVSGTMSFVCAIFYLGLKSIWMTHIFWGWFTLPIFMAFQAKWIRRARVSTFAEFNDVRFGPGRSTENARIATVIFLAVLMVFNLVIEAVGTGKFASEFLPFSPMVSTFLLFMVVGIYVTLGGFISVIVTDLFQTVLIALGAVILGWMVMSSSAVTAGLAEKAPGWASLAPSWSLWSGYLDQTKGSGYEHFNFFGPILLAGFSWLIFRALSGPNVWDFQFFSSVKSSRDASLAAGVWTVCYTIRWVIAVAFMMFGVYYLGSGKAFDAERVMPMVLKRLPMGMKGVFMAVMLAALMSAISAKINLISSITINDVWRRYVSKDSSERKLVRVGQIASGIALVAGFLTSFSFASIISAWETTIFVVVGTILVPATMRWHWWRFSARAFVWGMVASAAFIGGQKAFFGGLSSHMSLFVDTLGCFIATLLIGFLCKPSDTEALVSFYSRIKPFGIWGPIRREAVKRGLVSPSDRTPTFDAVNAVLCCFLQFAVAVVPFCLLLRQWAEFASWAGVAVAVSVVLYFTWYKTLPKRGEE